MRSHCRKVSDDMLIRNQRLMTINYAYHSMPLIADELWFHRSVAPGSAKGTSTSTEDKNPIAMGEIVNNNQYTFPLQHSISSVFWCMYFCIWYFYNVWSVLKICAYAVMHGVLIGNTVAHFALLSLARMKFTHFLDNDIKVAIHLVTIIVQVPYI